MAFLNPKSPKKGSPKPANFFKEISKEAPLITLYPHQVSASPDYPQKRHCELTKKAKMDTLDEVPVFLHTTLTASHPVTDGHDEVDATKSK